MTSESRFRLILLGVAGAIVVGVTLPWTTSLYVQTCEPNGFATVSANIYQDWFWQVQLRDIRRRIANAEKWDADLRGIRAAPEAKRQQMEDLYLKNLVFFNFDL
jgi:hypothetical protein